MLLAQYPLSQAFFKRQSDNMGYLSKEVDLYPNNLLDDSFISSEGDSTWWAVYTMARREKDLMRRLCSWEIPFYGPVFEKRNRSPQGRMRSAWVPLVPGYVFVHCTEEQRQKAYESNCISRCLKVPDEQKFVEELRGLRNFLSSGKPVTPEEQISAGTKVRVKSGSLIGQTGVVIERRGRRRLLVAVTFLQRGASIEMDDIAVEPV